MTRGLPLGRRPLASTCKAGLLIRQTHHWAADVFVVAIVLHLLRIFFTGAFRKPRELNYYVGLTMLTLALLEGFLGYSLRRRPALGDGARDRLLGRAVDPVARRRTSALLIWGGRFPGDTSFLSRMYIAHVLIFPLLIGGADRAAPRPGRRAGTTRSSASRERTPSGGRRRAPRCGPAYALALDRALRSPSPPCCSCSAGSSRSTRSGSGARTTVAQGTNGAQPDWYLGWLIGGLRLMPGWDSTIGDYTLVPNPFWGGVAFPLVVFGLPLPLAGARAPLHR